MESDPRARHRFRLEGRTIGWRPISRQPAKDEDFEENPKSAFFDRTRPKGSTA
jgi:hypothetical protein